MESYYYNSSTVLKYLRKVLNEIHKDYVDNGLRVAFIMKRYAEKYKFSEEVKANLVLLCILKDIGIFYQDGCIPKDNNALAAASSYTFLKYCSPLKEAAKPLLFYKAKYLDNVDNDDYQYGLLITLIDQVVMYVFQEYNLDEIESLLKHDKYGIYNPKHVKKLIKLLNDEEDILEKLNQRNSIFVYETSSYVQHINYSDEELLSFIQTTNFAFEFHNHETLGHTITTAIIARELAKLSRLTENQINCIYLAALVHDIGKIRVPREVLCNPGKLTGNDLLMMRKHVEYTKEIIEGSFSYKICEIAGNHHEKLDGSGYPRGLRAIDLSIGDKIISVADVASALYCKRSYKDSMSEDQIIAILKREVKEGKMESRIVNHFAENFDDIMTLARTEEKKVLDKYAQMKSEYQALKESRKLYSFFRYDVRENFDDENQGEVLDLYDLTEPVDLEALVNATFDGIYLGNEEDEEPVPEEILNSSLDGDSVSTDASLDEVVYENPTPLEDFYNEEYGTNQNIEEELKNFNDDNMIEESVEDSNDNNDDLSLSVSLDDDFDENIDLDKINEELSSTDSSLAYEEVNTSEPSEELDTIEEVEELESNEELDLEEPEDESIEEAKKDKVLANGYKVSTIVTEVEDDSDEANDFDDEDEDDSDEDDDFDDEDEDDDFDDEDDDFDDEDEDDELFENVEEESDEAFDESIDTNSNQDNSYHGLSEEEIALAEMMNDPSYNIPSDDKNEDDELFNDFVNSLDDKEELEESNEDVTEDDEFEAFINSLKEKPEEKEEEKPNYDNEFISFLDKLGK